ncbi:hypothetical protein cyc_00086 [Cyclospora cayetanensis]|uniref:Uncharacterized protein n=1 Tax=Cyclospora cayetanensis TaxID=88456 RepID=A0A1D3D452_9EIME|nr:hypothetical protein cyc_00086 [Cyclospora cayetanensis]
MAMATLPNLAATLCRGGPEETRCSERTSGFYYQAATEVESARDFIVMVEKFFDILAAEEESVEMLKPKFGSGLLSDVVNGAPQELAIAEKGDSASSTH